MKQWMEKKYCSHQLNPHCPKVPIYIYIARLDTLPPINHEIRPVQELPLITREIQTHIRYVLDIRQPAQWHIEDKLGPVLGRVLHPCEGREEPCRGEERADVVDADVMLAEFSGEAFRCLYTIHRLNSSNIYENENYCFRVNGHLRTFETAPLDALYQTSPGRGRAAPVDEILIIEPPWPCCIMRGMKIFAARKMLLTLTLKTRSHSASVTSAVG
jgi:hypothetical protein